MSGIIQPVAGKAVGLRLVRRASGPRKEPANEYPVPALRLDMQAACHRVGTLHPGENIVLVIAASAHRQAALDATSFLIDWLKTKAPFWKREDHAGGDGAWVDAREEDNAAASRWG